MVKHCDALQSNYSRERTDNRTCTELGRWDTLVLRDCGKKWSYLGKGSFLHHLPAFNVELPLPLSGSPIPGTCRSGTEGRKGLNTEGTVGAGRRFCFTGATPLLRKLMPCRRNHYSGVQTSPPGKTRRRFANIRERRAARVREGERVARQRYATVGNCHCGGQRRTLCSMCNSAKTGLGG